MGFEALIARWGYLAVAGGAFLEGETVVIAAGALANRGLLWLPFAVLAAFVGSLANDQLWFFLGRRFGRAFIAARPKLAARTARVEAFMSRWGALYVVAFRFLYGLRTVTPVLLGASGYGVKRFLLLNATGAALWALSYVLIGWGVGSGAQALFTGESMWAQGAALVAALIGVVALVVWRKRRTARASAAIESTSGDSAPSDSTMHDGDASD